MKALPPLLVAHRGATANAPENSASAFEAALAGGAAAIETDLRLTADGHLVCHHDASAESLFGSDLVFARASTDAALALRFTSKPDEGPILVDELFAVAGGRTLLDLEMKPDPLATPHDQARALAAALERAGLNDGLFVTSEDPRVLAALREVLPKIPRGLVYRSADRSDPIAVLDEAQGRVLVASHSRVDASLVSRARAAGLGVWCYTVNDAPRAIELATLGVDAIVSDRPARLARALPRQRGLEHPVSHDGAVLALDFGSSRMKAALIAPAGEMLALESVATPVRTGPGGIVEHDAEAVLNAARKLLTLIAARARSRPAAAAIAAQRSTGLVCRSDDLTPIGPALSWRDTRGDEIVRALESRRAQIEDESGLPLLAAWTAIKGRVIKGGAYLDEDERLAPLGSWLVARLTGCPLSVDPTLGNRTCLLDRSGLGWNLELLDAFGYMADQLPDLLPTRADYGSLPWPDGGRVPVEVLIGDQPAAYLGAVGPIGSAVVLAIGTGSFAMRAVSRKASVPRGMRRGPLYWRGRSPAPRRFLIEEPVLPTEEAEAQVESVVAQARAFARELALDGPGPKKTIERLRAALDRIVTADDRRVVLAGGALRCPHLTAMLARELSLVVESPRQREQTLVGAARLTVFSW